ncbi:MAG: hypothetical protein L0H26_12585 [Microlunatus sp.]|nr:hypothetical protein [Microlunatus sp.]
MTDDDLNQLFPSRRDQLAQMVPLVLALLSSRSQKRRFVYWTRHRKSPWSSLR